MSRWRIAAVVFLLGGTLVNFWHLVSLEMTSRYDAFANHLRDYNVAMASGVMYETIIITVAIIAFVLGKPKTSKHEKASGSFDK